MPNDILFAFWFLLPAAAANAVPTVSAVLPFIKRFDAPLDGGRTWRGKRLFGEHKTWRGIISGILAATLVLWIQQMISGSFNLDSVFADYIQYDELPVLVIGPLFAIGALGGDAIESFFKRQRGIQSGRSWMPFDQIDYVVGAILLTMPFVVFRPIVYVWMLIVWFGGHIAGTYIGWLLKLKKDPI